MVRRGQKEGMRKLEVQTSWKAASKCGRRMMATLGFGEGTTKEARVGGFGKWVYVIRKVQSNV